MVLLLALISTFFAFSYIYLLRSFKRGWDCLVDFSNEDLKTNPFVTIVIVARNEEENLIMCLESLQRQDYPPDCFEVLLFDDLSTDSTFDKVQAYHFPQLQVFQLAEYMQEADYGSNKKEALEISVDKAKGDYILVTDADSICPRNWIRTHVHALEQRDLNFITGPVYCNDQNSWIGKYQAMDLAGLLVITGGGFHNGLIQSANGANMGFRKKVFESLDGYKGFKHLASGDDIFLLQKVESAFPGTTGFNKARSCLVRTRPQRDFRSFINQRVRWASKTGTIAHRGTKIMLWYMMIYYLSIVCSFIMAWINLLWIGVFFVLVIAKIIADFSIVRTGLQYTDQEIQPKFYLQAEMFQVFYSVLVGINLLFRKSYIWKDRRITWII